LSIQSGGFLHHMMFQSEISEFRALISEKDENFVNLENPGMQKIVQIELEKQDGKIPYSDRHFRFR